MNPLLPIAPDTFKAGIDELNYFRNRLVKLRYGAIFYCNKGKAEITIDLHKYHVAPLTHCILLPNSILSVTFASEDFQVYYFVFSGEMMKVACLRLDPAFMHFLKEVACYENTKAEEALPIKELIKASIGIYAHKENQFRDHIAQNLLQIFFLNTYDKIERYFTKEQIEGNNRKEHLFKKFILLVHEHCVKQRDVTFYANELCISTRYLSAIAHSLGQHSAKAIIDEFLMLEIKVALQSTNLTLKELAEHYNFPDQSLFGRYFKKHAGMSPKEYKLRIK